MPPSRRLLVMALASVLAAGAAAAAAPPGAHVPSFWDPAHRQQKPDLSEVQPIRFLTESENPPYSFIDAAGMPGGLHVDLARAICAELDAACTIQKLRWNLLLDGLDEDRGDAIVASIAPEAVEPGRFDFTGRYLSRPARFVTRRDAQEAEMTPEGLAGRRIAVRADSAHAAYLADFFAEAEIVGYGSPGEARQALMDGEVYAVFGDGPNLSLWLNGAASAGCCAFRGGPYTESRYFGEGFVIAVRPGDETLRQAFNFALAQLHHKGVFAEIYRRYFPIGFY